jgi:hypothetical protein
MNTFGQPPEFGPSGEEPPVQSPMQLMAEDFFFVTVPPTKFAGHKEVLLPVQSASDDELDQVLSWFHEQRQHAPSSRRRMTQIRRIQVYKYWARDEPISRLAPGTSSSKTVEVSVGISRQTSRELAVQLGVHDLTFMRLTSQVSTRVAESITMTKQRKVAYTLTLDNTANSDRYRLFAIWHIENMVKVDAVPATLSESWISPFSTSSTPTPTGGHLPAKIAWEPLSATRFASSEAAVVTSAAIRI